MNKVCLRRSTKQSLLLSIFFLTFIAAQNVFAADELGKPTGDVLLVIDGDIQHSNSMINDAPAAQFDLDMLKALGPTTVTTSSPWADVSDYVGVRLDELLFAVGVDHEGKVVRATAIDQYSFDLNDLKLDEYEIIVAYEKNNKPLTVRELGPLWIIFPWDAHPELLNEKNKASSVWQLIGLTVQ